MLIIQWSVFLLSLREKFYAFLGKILKNSVSHQKFQLFVVDLLHVESIEQISLIPLLILVYLLVLQHFNLFLFDDTSSLLVMLFNLAT